MFRRRVPSAVFVHTLPHRVSGAVLLLAAALCLTGCGPGGPLRCHLNPDTRRPSPGVVIFLADGLPPGLVEQGCAEGWLPNVRKRFFEGGAHVRRAASTVPSITYAAVASMLTGVLPEQHQVVGNRWFDPEPALFRNYVKVAYYDAVNADCARPTIYERLQPAACANIQTALRRGVTYNIANWAVSGMLWFFWDFTAVDKLTASSTGVVVGWANTQRRWPTILTYYFPALDTVGHRFGPASPRYDRAIRHVDYQIGRVCDWLEHEGLLKTTYIVLLSDHGMIAVQPGGHIDMLALVRDTWGRKATDHVEQGELRSLRQAYYDDFDTIVNDLDGRCTSVHVRSCAGWRVRPTPAEVQAVIEAPPPEAQLWNIPGVELAAYLAADDDLLLRSGPRQARIRTRAGPNGTEYAYVPTPDDVLGYVSDPGLARFVSAGYHDSRAWLQATADQRLPDLVPPLMSLLHARRAGQVVLFAQPGYSFGAERGGHGGIDRDERLMTFALAGPGITPGTVIDTARAVDVTPTLLDLLGVVHDTGEFEGVSLVDAGLLSAEVGKRTE